MELHIEPRVVKLWDQFIIEKPRYSIALDGYVRGAPRFKSQKEELLLSFDRFQEITVEERNLDLAAFFEKRARTSLGGVNDKLPTELYRTAFYNHFQLVSEQEAREKIQSIQARLISGPYSNLNHHEEVDRLATRSTSGQAYVNIKLGLLDSYRVDGKVYGHIFVNDPDQDTCLAVWLLQNHERIEGARSEPLINRLVDVEDLLDVTAGAYPFDPSSRIMRQLGWVFQPYTNALITGRLKRMDESEMRTTIEAVGERISKHVLGEGKEIELDTNYDRIGGGLGWAMIKELGPPARTRLFHEGIKAFVSVRGEESGSFTYSIGKMSPFVTFPVQELYAALNRMEGIPEGDSDCWGGGNTISGSPRNRGSALKPKELETAINTFLRTK